MDEILQAVVFKVSYFQTQRGGAPPKPSKPPPTVVLEVLEVGYPLENNLRHCRATYLRYLGDRLDGRAVVGPCLHQKGALFNQIPPPIGGLYLVREAMG